LPVFTSYDGITTSVRSPTTPSIAFRRASFENFGRTTFLQRCAVVQQLAKELRIEFLFLPAYSPNRNLIEWLW
jgi:transposase